MLFNSAVVVLSLSLGLTVSALSLESAQSGSGDWIARRKPNGCDNSPTSRSCWRDGFDIHTDTETSWPNTGQTVVYNLEITNTTLSLDGTPKLALAVNGQVPGPLIEANWGDYLQITVKNSMQNNGTSMHWHGLRQLNSNDQDGVNGVTQCPIAPGDSQTYRFQATEYGTTWYHSHFSTQWGDGVQGPIIIHGPASANYDEEIGTIQVSDTYNLTAYQEDHFAERLGPPTASNYLLNGKNVKPDGSAGQRPVWTVKRGKKYLFRFINTSVDNHFKLMIDNHVMTVVQTDFVPITPYNTTSINIGIGQRYDVVVQADQPVAGYYIRGISQEACGSNQNTGLGNANGILKYDGADDVEKVLPTSTPYNYTDECVDEPSISIVPVVSKTVDSSGFVSQVSALPVGGPNQVVVAGDTVFRWYLNGISQIIDWANPVLPQVATGNETFAPQENVILLPNAGVWTYWIIQTPFFAAHPIHLHGHDFFLLGSGIGSFDPADSSQVGSLNFNNPPRRDVTVLPGYGWIVIAFKTDNPGSWLMHCHIAWHVGEGLSLQFLEIPSRIPSIYGSKVPQIEETCNNWKKYTAPGTVYNDTGSGLKLRRELGGGRMDVTRHLNAYRRDVGKSV